MQNRLLALFCENSSLRGVARAYHSRGFLRVAWAVYVLLMIGLLLSSVIQLCVDYMGYHTIIQTNVLYEKPEVFPAVTVCSHHPFSRHAMELWGTGRIMSPGNYSQGLKRLIREEIEAGNFVDVEHFLQHDQLQYYYQSLPPEHALALGLSEDDLFVHCHLRTSDDQNRRAGSLKQCGAKVRVWSNPKYFNCYTVEVPEVIKHDVSSLIFVLKLQKKFHSLHASTAFAQDIFEKAYGARIAIHEPGESPNFNRGGFHVEPGKMVEVSFRVVRWIEADTPKDQCVDHQSSQPSKQLPAIRDLDLEFQYNRRTCMHQKIADYVLRQCNCLMGNYPRPFPPTKSTPYCAHVDMDSRPAARRAMIERFRCRARINVSRLRKLFKEACDNPCHTLEYDLHVTGTRWSPTRAQIHWLLALTDIFREATVNRSLSRVLHYLHGTAPGVEGVAGGGEGSGNATGDDAEYAFVVLSRDNFNTVERREKLILTFDGLLSRLGGICSLSLGLSFAFLVELVEFVFRTVNDDDPDRRSCGCAGAKERAQSQENVYEVDETSNAKLAQSATRVDNNNDEDADSLRAQETLLAETERCV